MSIVRCDTGIGEQNVVSDPTLIQVTYVKGSSGAGEKRILALVGETKPIWITPVDSSAVVEVVGEGDVPITTVAGRG